MQIHLLWPLQEVEGVFFDVDRYKLSQVLRNLVSNALKFSSTGGQVTVTAVLKNRDGTIALPSRMLGTANALSNNNSNNMNTNDMGNSNNNGNDNNSSQSFHSLGSMGSQGSMRFCSSNIIRRGMKYQENSGGNMNYRDHAKVGIEGPQLVRISVTDSGPGISKVILSIYDNVFVFLFSDVEIYLSSSTAFNRFSNSLCVCFNIVF